MSRNYDEFWVEFRKCHVPNARQRRPFKFGSWCWICFSASQSNWNNSRHSPGTNTAIAAIVAIVAVDSRKSHECFKWASSSFVFAIRTIFKCTRFVISAELECFAASKWKRRQQPPDERRPGERVLHLHWHKNSFSLINDEPLHLAWWFRIVIFVGPLLNSIRVIS